MNIDKRMIKKAYIGCIAATILFPYFIYSILQLNIEKAIEVDGIIKMQENEFIISFSYSNNNSINISINDKLLITDSKSNEIYNTVVYAITKTEHVDNSIDNNQVYARFINKDMNHDDLGEINVIITKEQKSILELLFG